jgi:uncharacterized membrane protein (TIGR02234 family)
MSSGTPSEGRRLSPRWEYGLVLLLGAAGAGLVFLGVRQGWAHVHTSAPRPLPGSNVTVTGQDLVPAASALAIAGLATLAAVIATRGLARRLAGGLLVLFGAGAAASVLWPVSDATAIRAAASSAGLNGLAGSGTGAGSVTAGGSGGTGGTAPISGFLASVVMSGTAWRGLAVAGAALLVAAGLLTIWRSGPWPVMSSRYERPPRPAGPASPGPASTVLPSPVLPGPVLPSTASGGQDQGPGAGPPRTLPVSAPVSARTGRPPPPADLSSAAIWESLSRGEDPTSDPEP